MSMNTSNHPRILVVEDDAAIRLLTANALRKAGFNVLEACTADEGAALISDANLDAIVTDVEMPGAMDGYDLAWRAHAACPTTPLFVYRVASVQIAGNYRHMAASFRNRLIPESSSPS